MKFIKILLVHSSLIIPALMLTSAYSGNHPAPSGKSTLEILYVPVAVTGEEKDAKFMVKAAEIDLLEIRLGIMAQEKGKTKEVKDLGRMMEDGHNRSLTALTALATKKAITIPTTKLDDDALVDYRKLNNTATSDFDKEYCKMMIKAHKAAITLYDKESTGATDADIKQWVATTLPELRAHLDQAKTCIDHLNKK